MTRRTIGRSHKETRMSLAATKGMQGKRKNWPDLREEIEFMVWGKIHPNKKEEVKCTNARKPGRRR